MRSLVSPQCRITAYFDVRIIRNDALGGCSPFQEYHAHTHTFSVYLCLSLVCMCVIEKGVLVILEWEHFSSVCDVMILMTEPAVSAGVSPCSDAR